MSTPSITLSNESISIVVSPDLGGKIMSLRNLASGHEWLWTNPHLKSRPPVYGESYVEKIDFGGWDEIFPSVSPVTLADGTQIPDHGDLVFLSPEVVEQSGTSLSLVWTTRCVKCRFTRTLRLEGDTLHADYSVESLSADPIPYLWAAHPLIALENEMTLELASDDVSVELSDKKLRDILTTKSTDTGVRFTIHDPKITGVQPSAAKLFSQSGELDWLRLNSPKGGSLRMNWNAKQNPYLGIWLNLRGWSGCGSVNYFNLGLEPTTSPCDGLDAAISNGKHRILESGKTHEWAYQVSLHS